MLLVVNVLRCTLGEDNCGREKRHQPKQGVEGGGKREEGRGRREEGGGWGKRKLELEGVVRSDLAGNGHRWLECGRDGRRG